MKIKFNKIGIFIYLLIGFPNNGDRKSSMMQYENIGSLWDAFKGNSLLPGQGVVGVSTVRIYALALKQVLLQFSSFFRVLDNVLIIIILYENKFIMQAF